MRNANVATVRRQCLIAIFTLSSFNAFAVTQDIPDKTVLGNTEPVALVNGDICVLVDAKVDTGADRSSIGEALAEVLELDLDDADTATFSSALGETERPIIDVTFYLAGEDSEVEVSVGDRDDLSQSVLIGRDVLVDFLVDVESEELTTPFGESEDTEDELGCDDFDD